MKKLIKLGLVCHVILPITNNYKNKLNNKLKNDIVLLAFFEGLWHFVISLKAMKRYFIFLLPFYFDFCDFDKKDGAIC